MQYGRFVVPVASALLLGSAALIIAADEAAPDDAPVAGGEPDCPTRPRTIVARDLTTTATFGFAIDAADLDGSDGNDLVSASLGTNTIAWWENDGNVPPAFTERAITTSASGPQGLFAIDVNGDTDVDVIAATGLDDTVAWWENDGNDPPSFTRHVITAAADNARAVFGIDIDGDTDVDVVAASTNDGTVAWFENDGMDPPTFTEHVRVRPR
jgi:hypothetical protein